MLEFIILMVVLDILLKIKAGTTVETEPQKPKPKAYVCGNTAEWDFKTLDDPACLEKFKEEFLKRVPDGEFITPSHGEWIHL